MLILGGYGTFGGRLVRLLSDDARLTLIIAGRSHAKAAAFCATLDGQAKLVTASFDRDGDVAEQIGRIAPDLVVDASGPFQAYGEQPYRIVQAALALGIDYMDLADGATFVQGIRQFDDAARRRGLFVLSGVSTCPVLTAAVVRRLAQGMQQVDSVTAGITPSPHAGIGLSVVRAIASYAGQAVLLLRDGHRVAGHALTETMRYTIAPPGCLPLRNIRFSLVDVPDLQVLPELWPELRSVWFGAGPVPELLHRVLGLLAWGVRLGLLRSLAPLAGLLHRASTRLRWGEHRGGMFVALHGVAADGARRERSWHMIAEGDDGPFIPAMAAAAIVRRCLEKKRPTHGARSAVLELELDDYEDLFAQRAIHAGVWHVASDQGETPLYQRLLADAWMSLPAPLRAMHDVTQAKTVHGVARVERGRGWLARLIGMLFRFPRSGEEVPVDVTFVPQGDGERWQRSFAGRRFASVQTPGYGRLKHLVVERFGPCRFGLAVVLDRERLRLVVRRWSVFGLPLPVALAPRGEAFEFAQDDLFHFHVEIGHWLTGLIVRYRGWLAEPPICDRHVAPGQT